MISRVECATGAVGRQILSIMINGMSMIGKIIRVCLTIDVVHGTPTIHIAHSCCTQQIHHHERNIGQKCEFDMMNE